MDDGCDGEGNSTGEEEEEEEGDEDDVLSGKEKKCEQQAYDVSAGEELDAW